MASWDHDGIVELFRSDPKLVPELLSGPLGIELPAFSATRVESGEFTQVNPAELRSDLVVSLSNGVQLVYPFTGGSSIHRARAIEIGPCFTMQYPFGNR